MIETGEILWKSSSWLRRISGSLPQMRYLPLYAAIIVKKVDAKTRAKVGINELLRAAE